MADDPSTLDPNSTNSAERIALFRTIKFLRELASATEVRLTRE